MDSKQLANSGQVRPELGALRDSKPKCPLPPLPSPPWMTYQECITIKELSVVGVGGGGGGGHNFEGLKSPREGGGGAQSFQEGGKC